MGFLPAACPSLCPNADIMIAARTGIIASFAPTRGRTGGCAGCRWAECDPSVIGDLFAMHEPVPAIADLECDPPRRRVGKARPVDDSGCRSADIARRQARTRRSGDLQYIGESLLRPLAADQRHGHLVDRKSTRLNSSH